MCDLFFVTVSIQPKPKTGLEGGDEFVLDMNLPCFNPAEAEDGFRRCYDIFLKNSHKNCFNPAEAEDGFRRKKKKP